MHLSRFRPWLAALALALSALLPSLAQAAEPPAAKPNVVFMLVDDLDEAVYRSGLEAGLYPNLKNLIATGTSFSNSFVALSVCCPSRATLLTGQYPHNHGVLRNAGPAGGFKAFKDSATLPLWLKAAGYRTALMGKYLNGYDGKTKDYVPPGWDTWNALLAIRMYSYAIADGKGGATRYGTAPQDYQTDVYAGLAENYIRGAGKQPYFLLLTPSSPHLEGQGQQDDDDGGNGIRPAPRHIDTPAVSPPVLATPAFNEQDMSDKPAFMRAEPPADKAFMTKLFNEKRAAMRSVDDMVGRLVKALKDTGQWDRTLFVFASDNGYQYGTHRNGARKADLYEESIRVPLVIKAPGQTTGRVTEGWALNTDWAPTVLDFAGVAPSGREPDGRSLAPLVRGEAGGRRSILVELPPVKAKAKRPGYFALRTKDPSLTLDASGKQVLVYAEMAGSSDKEFYDLDADPLQVQSLHASTDSRRRQQMQAAAAKLGVLKACKGEACRSAEN